jgi:hypothetical protein
MHFYAIAAGFNHAVTSDGNVVRCEVYEFIHLLDLQ